MTISATESRISYSGNGVTTAFAFPYPFTADADLVVILVDADGTETTQTLTTHYTVTGAGSSSGSVTMLTAPSATQSLVIYREVDITQETDYITGDAFPAETHEAALDKLTQIAQQLNTGLSRAVRLPGGDTTTDVALPLPTADYYWKWNSLGTAITFVPASSGIADAASITYSPAGTGAASRTVQARLRDRVSRNDYDTDGNFDTARATLSGRSEMVVRTEGGSTDRLLSVRLADFVSVKDFGAVGDGVADDTAAIQAAHDAVSAGATLVIPFGTYMMEGIEFTKSLNIILQGTLKRISTATFTDSVLELSGDDSSITGGGTISWNSANPGTDTGRGEALRLSGDRARVDGITVADTYTLTGNGIYVAGNNCSINNVTADNCTYAGVRTNMGGLDVGGEPTDVCTIANLKVNDCLRGWVNNAHALNISIDNMTVTNPKASAEVAILGETGADVKFHTCNISNTHLKHDVIAGALTKFVGVKYVNLVNCTFDGNGVAGVAPLILQNEHTGTDTYQENLLRATNCTFIATDAYVVNVDHLGQWRMVTNNCKFVLTTTGSDAFIDADSLYSWRSHNDEFNTASGTSAYIVRCTNWSDPDRFLELINSYFTGNDFPYMINCVAPDVGQFTVINPTLEATPTSSNIYTNSATKDAGVIISQQVQNKGTNFGAGRDFSAWASTASGLTYADYEQGDRVWVKDVGDTGIYLYIAGDTTWRSMS